MAKKPIRTKKTQTKKGTNWLLIGGVAVVGIIGLFGLLYLALREPDSTRQSLAEYCDSADGNCISYGEVDAPITFVEVSDFGCPHCRAFHQEKAPTLMERYVDTGDVRWLFVPYALRAETVPAANAAMCANDQGQYVEFASALFNTEPVQEALTRDGFIAAAEEVGLNIDSFSSCLEEGRYNRTVATNQEAARRVGVSATPSFFVNDQIIRGNVPLEEFERRFQLALSS